MTPSFTPNTLTLFADSPHCFPVILEASSLQAFSGPGIIHLSTTRRSTLAKAARPEKPPKPAGTQEAARQLYAQSAAPKNTLQERMTPRKKANVCSSTTTECDREDGCKMQNYSTRDSRMVTHFSTNLAIQCLDMAERTGCLVFIVL